VLGVSGWPHSHIEVSLITTLNRLRSKNRDALILTIIVILSGALTMLMASYVDVLALPLALSGCCR
jgi:hypothetical protein